MSIHMPLTRSRYAATVYPGLFRFDGDSKAAVIPDNDSEFEMNQSIVTV